MPPEVEVGLLRAQDGLQVVLDPGTGAEKAAETLQQMPVSGFAGLLDSVEAASQLGDRILGAAKVRVAILYLTDSSINNYREDYTNPVVNQSDSRDMSRRFPEGLIREKIRQLVNKVRGSEAPLFIAHLEYRNDRLNEAYQTGLIELAAATGGTAEFCRSVADIPAVISGTVKRILGHQLAELELGSEAGSGPFEIVLQAEGTELRYREKVE
jgi:hypothetical protein